MSLLSPASIAVIGASAQEGKVGHDILQNLLTQGFRGEIYPVNPKGGEILGKRAYTKVSDIPGHIDLAIIVTPAATVPSLVRECEGKGIPSVIVISAGFGETGTEQGRAAEEEIRKTAQAHKMALVGVNCLGVLRPGIGMNASFATALPRAGNIALVSQSGALAVGIMDASNALGLGYSLVVSVGNKTVMDECDFLGIAASDHETRVIGLYLESIGDGRRFRTMAERIAREKPIVLLKGGVTARGAVAASSHTGALAGSDAGVEAVCRQTGIRRVRGSGEFLDLLRALSLQPPLLSPRIAVITNAGGPGILATDAAGQEGLLLPPLQESLVAELRAVLPAAASIGNPIDVLGDAGSDRYGAALAACANDPGIDGVAVILTPQIMTPSAEIARAIAAMHRRHPLMPVTVSFFGGESVREATNILTENGIPAFPSPERAIRALAALLPRRPTEEASMRDHARHSARAEAAEHLFTAEGPLGEDALRHLLTLYGFPLPSQAVAKTAEEAATIAESLGFPVIAKIASRQILHKTDIGGVRANLKSPEEVACAFREILDNVSRHCPDARADGALIQKFLPAGNEFIVGVVRDPSFGPLVMAGLGGIYTEVFRDSTFRIAPLSDDDAYEMLQELKSWKILLGMRGGKQADIAALASLLRVTSEMVCECPRIQTLDFNPVLIDEAGVTIVDAKVVVE